MEISQMAARSGRSQGGLAIGKIVRRAGFSLLEVLVALVIVVVGLLGVIGLQAVAQQSEFES